MAEALTHKQQRFIAEYLIDLNATAAYKRAGYNSKGRAAESNAARLMGNDRVAKIIQDAMDRRANELGIDAKYVLTTIKDTIRRCQQVQPVLDRKGDPVMVRVGDGDNATIAPAYEFDASGVLKGAELLGKHLKMFTDKTEHTGAGGGPIVVSKVERVIIDHKK